jgi:uncharacterized protein YndB with AHSA1/START domain
MASADEALVVRLSRQMRAPRERVFVLLTVPDELARWFGPAGFTIPAVSVDLRVGGRYRITMQPPDGEAFHLSGEFVDVDPPRRLRYTFEWEEPDPDDRRTLVDLTLGDLGDVTEVSLVQGDFATAARLDLHRDGWRDSLEKLAAEAQSPSG